MAEDAAQESAPREVWSMLRAWVEEITSADYTDAVSLETLCELRENRPRPLQLPDLGTAARRSLR